MTSIDKVAKICRAIKGLTEEDFEAVTKMAKEQIAYIHPLKNGKATKLHKFGKHNLKVLEHLRKTKETIDELEA